MGKENALLKRTREGLESENDIGANEMAVRVQWDVPHQSPMYVLELTLTGVFLSDSVDDCGSLARFPRSSDSHSVDFL